MEALRPHLLAQEADHVRAEDDVLVQLFAAQVEVAVLEAHVLAFVGLLVRHVEGRHLGGRLHHQFVRLDLDLARRQIGVDGVGRAELHLARHGDHAFEVRLLHETEEAAARMDHDLREAVVVAEVHEKDAAVVAETEHPPREADRLARVRSAEFIARMGTVWMHDVIFPLEKRTWIIPYLPALYIENAK